MKVGVLSPTTWQLIEKMAALFPEGVEVVGPLSDDGHYWNDYRRKLNEWEELGLQVSLNLAPYSDLDFSQYDVLIESAETFEYSKDWLNHCQRIECPILLKACWTRDPWAVMPPDYLRKIRHFPALLEMPAHAELWGSTGFKDVNVIFNPVGEWWFAQEWTGQKEQILYVLSGTKSWRGDPSFHGFEIWDKLCRAFPGKTYHHDGHESYKTSKEMVELFSQSRVFVNLDRPFGHGERPLTLVFTEALSAGLPVVARNLPGLSYKGYIDTNGVCTNDFEVMVSFIEKCLSDLDYARECSARSREIARQNFSYRVLRPKYERIIERAQKVFEEKKRGLWPVDNIIVSSDGRSVCELDQLAPEPTYVVTNFYNWEKPSARLRAIQLILAAWRRSATLFRGALCADEATRTIKIVTNLSSYGWQLVSRPVKVNPHSKYLGKLNLKIEAGGAGVHILGADRRTVLSSQYWYQPRADFANEQFVFGTRDNSEVFIVIISCSYPKPAVSVFWLGDLEIWEAQLAWEWEAQPPTTEANGSLARFLRPSQLKRMCLGLFRRAMTFLRSRSSSTR